MKLFRLRTDADYITHVAKNEAYTRFRQQRETELTPNDKQQFTVTGVSYPANKVVDFKVDYQYSDGKNINWRERLVCPVTGLNNRLRCSLHIADIELQLYPGSRVYLTEQVTPLFDFFAKRYPGSVGSEFLNPAFAAGSIHKGIRHEDMTQLSFNDAAFDAYLSFECFEHIPKYQDAIPEIYRVLKPGGVFLGTFPFDINQYQNHIKATVDAAGNIVYFAEPEYHGDPVNEKGILCYTIFGWEFLDEFRRAGFRDVYLVLVWSDLFGYLGGEQIFFIAKK